MLVTDTSDENPSSDSAVCSYRMPEGVDGMLKSNGILKFNEIVDM